MNLLNNTDMKDKRVLYAAMITSFMTTFMSSALNLSVPALESSFGVSAAAVSWVVSAYTISVAAMSLPLGKIADISSRRTVFLAGIAGFGLLSLVCIFAWNIAAMIVFRVLMGISAAMVFATNNSILISCYPPEIRGKLLGLSVAGTYVGLTAGPVAGGILNSTLGWRSIFAFSAAVSLAAFLAAFRAVPHDRPDQRSTEGPGHFDMTGTILYILAVAASLYGMTKLGTGLSAVVVLAAGLAALAGFFIHEAKRESSGMSTVMRMSMFAGSRTFTFSSLAALLNYGATFAISYMISIYLQVIKGLPSSTAGLMLIIMPAAQAALSPLMGSLSDRISASVLASSGMGICALTLLMFSRIGFETSAAYVVTVLGLTGLGFALFSSPNTNAILSCVEQKDYGVANSIIATMRTYGQSSGMAVLTMITSMILGQGTLDSSPKTDILNMMHISFIVFACICVTGIFFSLARDKH